MDAKRSDMPADVSADSSGVALAKSEASAKAEAQHAARRARWINIASTIASVLLVAFGLGLLSAFLPEPGSAAAMVSSRLPQRVRVSAQIVGKYEENRASVLIVRYPAPDPERGRTRYIEGRFGVSEKRFEAAHVNDTVLVSYPFNRPDEPRLEPASGREPPVPPVATTPAGHGGPHFVAGVVGSVLVVAAGLLLPFAVLAGRGMLWARRERKRWETLMSAPDVWGETPADDSDPVATPEQVVAAFRGIVPPVEPSMAYRVGLAHVAGALVLLVLAYVGLIVLVVGLIVRHAVENVSILGWDMPAVFRELFYLAPIGIGAILVLFMIKPLVALSLGRFRTLVVNPREQPALAAFIGRMAASVGAPSPARIELHCDANASVGYDGVWGALRGGETTVGIGLPLAAGLSAQELGHVVAHELAHCTQRAGLRFSALIRGINFWFARVIYERDMWDDMLSGAHAAGAGRVLMWAAWPFIKLTRGVLWCLGWAGSAVSCLFSRQLEYDADRCAVESCGVDAYESGQQRIMLLDFSAGWAHQELVASWERRRLADNLPRFIAGTVARLPEKQLSKALAEAYAAKTKLFDTHPSAGERLRAAKRAKGLGVFRLDGPATALFRDFDRLSRRATAEFYRQVIGETFEAKFLVPTERFLREQTRLDDEGKALHRYAGGVYAMHPPMRFVAPVAGEAPTDEDRVARLKQARAQTEALAESARAAARTQRKTADDLGGLSIASLLLLAGIPIQPKDFGLTVGTMAALVRRRQQLREQDDAASGELGVYLSWMAVRMDATLRLLDAPAVRAGVPDADALATEAGPLLDVLSALAGAWDDLMTIRREHVQASWLGRVLQKPPATGSPAADFVGKFRRIAGGCRTAQAKAGGHLAAVPYPFEHGRGSVNLSEYVVGELPAEDDLGAVLAKDEEVLAKAPEVYYQTLGRLAAIAERVEGALGLPPGPEPPDEPEPETPPA